MPDMVTPFPPYTFLPAHTTFPRTCLGPRCTTYELDSEHCGYLVPEGLTACAAMRLTRPRGSVHLRYRYVRSFDLLLTKVYQHAEISRRIKPLDQGLESVSFDLHLGWDTRSQAYSPRLNA